MTLLTFADARDLPVGTFEPCLLIDIKRHEPSAESLLKWPGLKPSYCFKFVQQGGQYDGYTAIRFANESTSKLSALFQFVTDLCGGTPPAKFDPADYIGRCYRIRVREKPESKKLFVASADPLTPHMAPAASRPARPQVAAAILPGDETPF